MLRQPRQAFKTLVPGDWSKRTIILLVMQTLDNSIRLRPIEKRFGRGVRLQTEQDPDNPNPTYIEAANDAARRLADKVGRGPEPRSSKRSRTSRRCHILGGAVIGRDYHEGVIDPDGCVFAHENMLVTDGSAILANPGVNWPDDHGAGGAHDQQGASQVRRAADEPVRTTWRSRVRRPRSCPPLSTRRSSDR